MSYLTLSNIFSFFRRKLGPGSFAYTIFKPCHRCVYGRRREPIIILSGRNWEVKDVVNLDYKTYTRRGECLGIASCQRCLEKIKDNSIELPCKWIRI